MTAPIERTCLDCYEDIPQTETAFFVPTSPDEQFWLGKSATEGPLCADCKVKRENAEPADPDGECFRGVEAAAFEAEQMAAERRLK